jgi:hypothetical protein
MTVENLIQLKKSLENTLNDVNKVLESNSSYPVFTQFDEGGYTKGYEEKREVYIYCQIDEEEGTLLLNFYSE